MWLFCFYYKAKYYFSSVRSRRWSCIKTIFTQTDFRHWKLQPVGEVAPDSTYSSALRWSEPGGCRTASPAWPPRRSSLQKKYLCMKSTGIYWITESVLNTRTITWESVLWFDHVIKGLWLKTVRILFIFYIVFPPQYHQILSVTTKLFLFTFI